MAANKNVKGFPDTWGQHQASLVEHPGPTSYVQGGETLAGGGVWPKSFAHITNALSYSGTYYAECIYPGTGTRTTVQLIWKNAGTGQEVSNGVNLSGETVRLLVIGG